MVRPLRRSAARTVANPFDISTLQTILGVRGANDLTLSGAISGFGSLAKNGAGKLTLTGANTYLGGASGMTNVNAGTLLVNGSLTASGVIAASGATLGGSGSIAGPVTSTGTVAPGASIGTLSLGLSLTLNDTSSLTFELGSAGSHDLINVGTDLTLPSTGSAVAVNLANAGGMGAGTFTLIDYAGTLNGDFSTLMLGTQPAGFTYSLINDTANTEIDLLVTVAAGVPGDYNGNGVVDGADYVLWRTAGRCRMKWIRRARSTQPTILHGERGSATLRAAAACWAEELRFQSREALSLAILMVGSVCLGRNHHVRGT